jgi:multicomponent Na+:H+ antiporter subunit D
MKLPLVLPLLIPLLTAIACILAGASRQAQRTLSILGSVALLVAGLWLLRAVSSGGIQAVQLGNWPAPYGITLVADLFSGLMVAITGFVALCVAIFALSNIDPNRERFGFYPLYHFLLLGVCGSFLTGDLFNLFVWFEVMLMSSFVLLALGGERPQIEAAVKYLTLNFIASGLFLTALGILYGQFGTLNMADLAVKLRNQPSGAALSSAMLLFVSFGIKAGVFPLFFWLPASYHTPPAAVSAIFAGLLTKVGVYALIRVFTLIFTADPATTHTLIIVVSVLTMITGVLGAAAQYEVRRVLSFHIISQIGYMTLGLGLFTKATIAAAIFYVVHHIIVKTNLFLIAGAIGQVRGTGELKRLGGLYHDYPWLALLFLIAAMSLGGVPPLSGFFAKFALIKAALDLSSHWPVVAALAVGLLTLFSMTKIWAEAFWKAEPTCSAGGSRGPVPRLMLTPIVAMAMLTVAIGLFPGVLLNLATRAADQLMNPDLYIETVLGISPVL